MAYEEGRHPPVLARLRKALFRKAASPASRLSALGKDRVASADSHAPLCRARDFQRFSTPTTLGLAALRAAAITAANRVCSSRPRAPGCPPSSPRSPAAPLVLNELAECRGMLLSSMLPANCVTRFDAAKSTITSIQVLPEVVLMNPPFFGEGERFRPHG
ncbi:hypothetical protein [Bradyrhizobium vignae]|uniref:hypothetical protein n=1 Tax=Bradyrhizobium vignae TaxID=1549949 RepID=UPI001ABFB221